jgi:O-acetyl-ADP-ribose deacetylase (regulator of RNase III)
MPFNIVRQDITKMKADAIVNAANTDLAMGGGVCGAIFRAAGADKLQAACDKLAPIKAGEAVITPGFNLPAKHVIHAAGPVYRRQSPQQSEELLRAAYINSLERAAENGCESIAFPLISSGIYGYPKADALRVATAAIQDFLAGHDMDVSLAVFDKAAFSASSELLGEVASYIDEHYVDERAQARRFRQLLDVEEQALEKTAFYKSARTPLMQRPQAAATPAAGLDDLIDGLDEPFSKTLLRLIDAKGRTDAEVYKRANIDRKLFSKIRNPDYRPSKKTALALAVALELSLDETGDLLERAGYALSRAVKFDVIVKYFITCRKYDIFEINEVLFHYDQPLLGG